MEILLIFTGFILAIIIVTIYEIKLKNQNKVHFYVARDKTYNLLWLYLGKPIGFKDDAWLPGKHGKKTIYTGCLYLICRNNRRNEYDKRNVQSCQVF